MSEATKDSIKTVISALSDAIVGDSISSYESVKDNPIFVDAAKYIESGMIDEFTYLFVNAMEDPINGLVASKLNGNEKAQFLFLKHAFIESSFLYFIKKVEGWPCSSDKSGAIISKLYQFFINGKNIEFDLNGKYTYHIPKKVFTNHDEIIRFFDGLYSLYYGDPEKYVSAVADMYKYMADIC